MGYESTASGGYISDLNPNNPEPLDAISQADEHLRLIKSTLKTTFPNIQGAINASHTEINGLVGSGVQSSDLTKLTSVTASASDLNKLDGLSTTGTELGHVSGVTSAIQTQIDTKAPSDNATMTGDTTVANLKIGNGGFCITYDASSNRLDFRYGTTVIMSLDQDGDLRVRRDISAFDTSA